MEKTKENILDECARKYNYEGLRELQHWDQHDKIELAAYDAMDAWADQSTQSLQADVERLRSALEKCQFIIETGVYAGADLIDCGRVIRETLNKQNHE